MAIERITPEEAKEKIESGEYLYIDVRASAEFAGGHVPGAYNLPILERGPAGMLPNQDFLTVARANFEKDAKIIVGCLRGGRSMKAASVLIADGYTNILDMRGGFDGEMGPDGGCSFPGWQRRGLPVSTEPDDGKTYDNLKSKA